MTGSRTHVTILVFGAVALMFMGAGAFFLAERPTVQVQRHLSDMFGVEVVAVEVVTLPHRRAVVEVAVESELSPETSYRMAAETLDRLKTPRDGAPRAVEIRRGRDQSVFVLSLLAHKREAELPDRLATFQARCAELPGVDRLTLNGEGAPWESPRVLTVTAQLDPALSFERPLKAIGLQAMRVGIMPPFDQLQVVVGDPATGSYTITRRGRSVRVLKKEDGP